MTHLLYVLTPRRIVNLLRSIERFDYCGGVELQMAWKRGIADSIGVA